MKKQPSLAFKNIVVGVDFTPYSRIVVKQALRLARQFEAKVTLVHAAAFPMTFDADYTMMRNTTVDLASLGKSLRKFYRVDQKSKSRIIVKEGEPVDILLAEAKKLTNPLIIVGSQGRGTLSRFLVGSDAEKIAMKSPYPVWVHRGRKTVPLHKIVMPTDLSANSQTLMKKIRNWKFGKNISLRYLFVRPASVPMINYPQYKEAMDKIRHDLSQTLQQFKRQGPKVPLITAEGNAAERITQIGNHYDVIAMNPHHHSGFLSSYGHLTSKVMRLSHNPVLVLKS